MAHLTSDLATPRPARFALTTIIALYLMLATLNNLCNPLFEAPDEIWHYLYARHLAAGQGLPEPGVRHSSIWAQQEAGQPPLYYAVAAALSSFAPRGDLPDLVHENTHASVGDPTSDRNKNRFVHSPAESFPWPGEVLAVRLARLASTLFGGLTVACTFLIAREIWPRRLDLAVGAALANAAIPQFAYIGGAVSNDTAAAATSSLVLWLSVRLFRRGPDGRRSLMIGLAVGLAILAKFGGITSIALPLLALAWWSVHRPQPRRAVWPVVRSIAIQVATITLVSGWWFARNYFRYGELVPLRSFLGRERLDDQVPSLIQIVHDLPGLWMSFWAVYGWFSILVSQSVYRYYDLLAMAALVALAIAALRHHRADGIEVPGIALLITWAVIVFVALLRYRLIVLAFQGRLLFPAVSAFAILFYWGLTSYAPSRWRWPALAVISAGLIPLAIALPLTVIASAYERPTVGTSASIGPPAHAQRVQFGEGIELLGDSLDRGVQRPGDTLTVTLYWHSLRAVSSDYSVSVHLRDPRGQILTQSDSFPGGGNFATSLWQPGDAFTDEIHLRVPADVAVPMRANLFVALSEAHSRQRLPVTVKGEPSTANEWQLGSIHLTGNPPTSIPNPSDTVFAGQIALRGHSIDADTITAGGQVRGHLYYQALAPISQDLTVFVHLSDDRRSGPSSIIAQQDQQPMDGAYPTSFWLRSEIVPYAFTLLIPPTTSPGRYTLITGLYDLKTGARLQTEGGNAVRLGAIEVKSP